MQCHLSSIEQSFEPHPILMLAPNTRPTRAHILSLKTERRDNQNLLHLLYNTCMCPDDCQFRCGNSMTYDRISFVTFTLTMSYNESTYHNVQTRPQAKPQRISTSFWGRDGVPPCVGPARKHPSADVYLLKPQGCASPAWHPPILCKISHIPSFN